MVETVISPFDTLTTVTQLPSRQGSLEIGAEAMDLILETFHGVTFLPTAPKKDFQIADDTLKSAFGEANLDDASLFVSALKKYYHGQPIEDRFGLDHNSRCEWREEMFKQYGQIFLERYEQRNQFRGNMMCKVAGGIDWLAGLAKEVSHDRLASRLADIYYELLTDEHGKNITESYNLCERIEEKLYYVRLYEKKAEEALEYIASAEFQSSTMIAV